MAQVTSVTSVVPSIVVNDSEFKFTVTYDGAGDSKSVTPATVSVNNFDGGDDFNIISVSTTGAVSTVTAVASTNNDDGAITINVKNILFAGDATPSTEVLFNSKTIKILQSPTFSIYAETTDRFDLSSLFVNPLQDQKTMTIDKDADKNDMTSSIKNGIKNITAATNDTGEDNNIIVSDNHLIVKAITTDTQFVIASLTVSTIGYRGVSSTESIGLLNPNDWYYNNGIGTDKGYREYINSSWQTVIPSNGGTIGIGDNQAQFWQSGVYANKASIQKDFDNQIYDFPELPNTGLGIIFYDEAMGITDADRVKKLVSYTSGNDSGIDRSIVEKYTMNTNKDFVDLIIPLTATIDISATSNPKISGEIVLRVLDIAPTFLG